MDKRFKRILIIKMRFHGDMLLTTPVISTLKRQYPDAKVDVLLYQDTMPILSENPEINALYGIKNKGSGAGEKVSNFLSLIKTLRANRYDLIVNLTDQWMVALLVRFVPAQMKITQDYHHRQSAFWKSGFTHVVPTAGQHIVERNLSALAPLDIENPYTATTMSYRPEHWESLQQRLRSLGVESRYVVIQPTARQLFKCWDDEKFSEVIDALQAKGLKVVLTSGPGADDLACINHIAQGCKTPPVTELAGKTSFPELGALIDHAALFIGVDSAPMHISAAVKTPVVCLFGATDRVFWRPWTDNAVVLWAGDYQTMPERDLRDRNKKYLSVIPAIDVIQAAERLLPEIAPEVSE
ncbi:lipopolysaccharide core heptosyltransferase RfaQ [Leminorella grimontii]|uniref:Lipopolysaccharide heptosyltransferase 3 n=1 Tax=Leminorella grimontii TaxID=82981 RepID=A0AAV5N6U3_9GAMM|nr:lipopolysaccharide core heptosyltransferase RfaQ [Leminorella grimontii]KFC98456.1 lipopolysaccharide heptosyltransferase III [Leminorella grimontii ATCC 33999 = DSM 5078]GKX57198.1 lipopolysaccharide core heptosyltransferase RfaQ [Leminorella grimontii]VFS56008.1 Lipopolysaccharide core heptosyltransferase rfaQ [Leminorella grimontii]